MDGITEKETGFNIQTFRFVLNDCTKHSHHTYSYANQLNISNISVTVTCEKYIYGL